MQSFLPPEIVGNVYALLAAISDPKAAKVALDKLVAESAAAKKIHAEAVEVSKQASADKEAAVIAMADARKITIRESAIDAREKEHAAREARLREKETALNDADTDLAYRMKVHDDAVAAHQDDVKATKAEIAAKHAAVKKSMDELGRKTEEFNKLMAPIMAATKLAGV